MRTSRGTALLVCVVSMMAGASEATTQLVRVPITCSRGSGGQAFRATVTMPNEQPAGATFKVRIDSVPSGHFSHFGLRYIYDMTTDYLLPQGATYQEGSARIVPGTGTANALPGAHVVRQGRILRLILPARITDDSTYTPPSIEFELRADGPAGTSLSLRFDHYQVIAHVFWRGDLYTACVPDPRPYTIGVTRIVAASH